MKIKIKYFKFKLQVSNKITTSTKLCSKVRKRVQDHVPVLVPNDVGT